MDLTDTPDQAAFRDRLRSWLAPRLTDTRGDPAGPPDQARGPRGDPRAWAAQLWAAGYAGLTWPTDFGGAGLEPSYQGIFAEEYAAAGGPDDPNVIGLNMVGPTLIRYGTPRQRAHHLPRILRGEQLFCQGFSEPGAGSDLAALATRAVATQDGFVVDGEKVWSSYAVHADHCLLLARTDPQAARHAGLTCFVLALDTPGVTVRPLRMLTGEAGFGQIVLTGAVIPRDAVVGEVGAGWRVAMTTLAHERGTFGVTLTARLGLQFDRLLSTVRLTGRDGDPVVRQEIARLYVDLESLRQTGYRALSTLEHTGEPGPESAVLKLHWSQTHQHLVAVALDLLEPGRHPQWESYWYRERLRSRGNSIEGGTSEILRGLIAERCAGLPRSR